MQQTTMHWVHSFLSFSDDVSRRSATRVQRTNSESQCRHRKRRFRSIEKAYASAEEEKLLGMIIESDGDVVCVQRLQPILSLTAFLCGIPSFCAHRIVTRDDFLTLLGVASRRLCRRAVAKESQIMQEMLNGILLLLLDNVTLLSAAL